MLSLDPFCAEIPLAQKAFRSSGLLCKAPGYDFVKVFKIKGVRQKSAHVPEE